MELYPGKWYMVISRFCLSPRSDRPPSCRLRPPSYAVIGPGEAQVLLSLVQSFKKWVNKKCSARPRHLVGVWLCIADLPLRLENWKLVPHFLGPFPITKVVDPVAVRLQLHRQLRIHHTFMSRQRRCDLVSSPRPPPPTQFIDRSQVSRAEVCSISWTQKGMTLTKGPGCHYS